MVMTLGMRQATERGAWWGVALALAERGGGRYQVIGTIGDNPVLFALVKLTFHDVRNTIDIKYFVGEFAIWERQVNGLEVTAMQVGTDSSGRWCGKISDAKEKGDDGEVKRDVGVQKGEHWLQKKRVWVEELSRRPGGLA